ncbi:MAG: protein translocase subunit SecF [Bacteroidetes bacterium]|jgi:preprotein translocase subunit SecF|nr:MAG: protein translocase subunit SecF [Bacteroidota bacterium]PTM20141.1 MAG: protein translocase subunit SecF [Bacteroidota bacterium]
MKWFETPSFDFIRAQKMMYIISGVLFVSSIVAILTMGLNYGIDFRGGKEFVLDFEQPVDVVEIRNALTEPLESTPELKLFGSDSDILIRTDAEGDISEISGLILAGVGELYPENPATVIKTDVVGPRFADDLKIAALNSILFAVAVVFIYILIRFKGWYYSAGAVTALIHDVVIVLGIFTLIEPLVSFNVTIDQALIAAFLTIVGYSLNDTVVVFDRIRENQLIYKTMEFKDMINKSLNDTLSRTVITSLTTLFVVVILFLFGGEVLKGFAFALVLGVIIGTYSSLFVASAMVVELQKRAMKAKA